jgi:hypothetical protein
MKTALVTLLLLSFALTACIFEPGRGYGGHGYYDRGDESHGGRGVESHGHSGSRDDHERRDNWGH